MKAALNSAIARLAGLNMRTILMISLAVGGIYYFMYYDDGGKLQKDLAERDAVAKQEDSQRKISEDALQQLEQVRTSVGALSDQFKNVSQQLPSEIQMAEIVRSVDIVAKSSGVSIKLKEPQKPLSKQIIEEIPLMLKMEGSFSEITMFIYYVSSLERITRVRNFSIISMPNSNRLRFEGNVISYRYIGDAKK